MTTKTDRGGGSPSPPPTRSVCSSPKSYFRRSNCAETALVKLLSETVTL